MIRIGMVDFDTSHVQAFTQRLNHLDISESEWVDGALVVAGCPGISEIMPERIPGYREKLAEYGVEIVSRPEDLIGKVDAVMVESQQGNKHLAHARLFLEAGLPVYVDKPFVETLAEADEMIALAERKGLPLMSCSSLRYDDTVAAALVARDELGDLLFADAWTPALLHPGNPGLLHYGIHGVEILYALLGPGCERVNSTFTEAGEVVAGIWSSGQVSSVRGLRAGAYAMGFSAHYERGRRTFHVEGASFYTNMLRQVVRMFETGIPPIPYAEMREIISFILAAEASRAAGGTTIAVA